MEYKQLGDTGLKASVAGLGCGGHSRLGLFSRGMDNAAGIVRHAYEQGVNFFDTAYNYGTHPAVAKGLSGIPRDRYLLSSKFPPQTDTGDLRASAELEVILDESLRALQTDYLDIWHLHGVLPDLYPDIRDRFLPELVRMRDKGKIRFIGITEMFGTDTRHEMLGQALQNDGWDVVMVGHSLLNPSAAKKILPMAAKRGIGTLCMFAVRSALSNPEQLKRDVRKMADAGQISMEWAGQDGVLDFLVENGHSKTIMEAAYRYCRHTKGLDVILTGTSDVGHLADNLASILMPPLPEAARTRLDKLFGQVDCVSGQ